jgi:RecA/RadA recombinase
MGRIQPRQAKSAPAAKKREGLYFENDDVEFLPTGSTPLDCALGGGWAFGRMGNIIGDKSTSKTGLGIEATAQYELHYPGEGAIFYREAEHAFGRSYATRLGLPKRTRMWEDDYKDRPFRTVEDLVQDIDMALNETHGDRSLYIVDSLDGLSDMAEMERNITEDSYGGTKQKIVGELFRTRMGNMAEHKMCFLIISQVKEAIGVKFGDKQRRAGGKALDYNASHCAWLAYIEREKKTIGGIERPVGIWVRANIKKNKVGNPWRQADFLYRFNYGVDDLLSCAHWLKEHKRLSAVGYNDIPALLKDAEKLGDADYRTFCSDVATVMREEYAKVEQLFMPTRQKYE